MGTLCTIESTKEAHPGLPQTSEIKSFAKIINSSKLLTIAIKSFIIGAAVLHPLLVSRQLWFCTMLWKNDHYFKLKFATKANLDMQNSMVVFTFSILGQKYAFWANLVQKIKIVTLSWKLVPRLIQICRIQCLFLFLTKNILFREIWSQNSELFV